MKTNVVVSAFLVSLAVIFSVGLLAPARATGVDGISTSECLGLPTEIVLDWKFLYPCCHDTDTCLDACENWVRTCNDIARIAYQCQYHSSRELTGLFKGSECDTLTDKDGRKTCSKDAGEELVSIRQFLSDNLAEAKGICFDCFEDCVSFCED